MSWEPTTKICYGFAVFPFSPISPSQSLEQGLLDASQAEEIVLHQVPLEVGDEVYVFEHYSPSKGKEAPWYRGYVVSSYRPSSSLPTSSLSDPSISSLSATRLAPSNPAEEPQVFVGIFPSTHVQIREELEDAERRLEELAAQVQGQEKEEKRVERSGSVRRVNGVAPMEPLKEEEEEDLASAVTPSFPSLASRRTSKALIPSNRSSISAFSQLLNGSANAANQPGRAYSGVEDETFEQRPPPPLPSLKCGDETLSGFSEPLVDEIACALREWSSLLFTHLHRREYALFNLVRGHIEALHTGRKHLLSGSLGTEEVMRLRRECVRRLVRGNVCQGLEVIVRHPVWGALVTVDTTDDSGKFPEGAEEEVDERSWVSAIRMYAMQVALAYGVGLEDGETGGAGGRERDAAPTSMNAAVLNTSASNPRLALPNEVGAKRRGKVGWKGRNESIDTILPTSKDKNTGKEDRAKFNHAFLDVRAFVGSLASAGELVELYFSLYNKSDSRFLTEEFCVVLNHHGAPAREAEGRLGMLRTLFRDLSSHDLMDQIFLVCKVVKNGGMKVEKNPTGLVANGGGGGGNGMLAPPQPTNGGETASFDSNITMAFNSTGPSMVNTSRTGAQTFRRPFGCAVLEISQFNKHGSASVGESLAGKEHSMPIFVPANEAAFSTLHEDIIASRIKEIEKSPRAESVVVSVRIFHGEAEQIVKENPSLLQDAPLTQRLGFPDVVFPGDQRNEVYIKLWSGDFTSGSGGQGGLRFSRMMDNAAGGTRNIEVSAEVRKRDGGVLDRAISRGTGEPRVSQYNSMVFKGNNIPTWGELMKLDIPMELMEICHLFFTFRNRNPKSSSSSSVEKPFGFAYLPLFPDGPAFIADGSHPLVIYKYERQYATPQVYFQAPYLANPGQMPTIPPSVSKALSPLRDSMVIRSFLCSTKYTQNEVLLKVLNWEKQLLGNADELKTTLTKLRFCSEVEVCKFLRNIFDALFGILSSVQNQAGEVDDLVFNAFVTILGIVSDRRFSNFRPVLDVYVERHFSNSTAWSHILKSLSHLLSDPAGTEAGQTLRSAIKVWHYLFKFVVRSREIQKSKDVGMGVTADHLQSKFKQQLSDLLSDVNGLMRAMSPNSIIGTQTLAVQHFAAIIPDLKKCFTDEELVDIVVAFGDAIVGQKGKIVIWKLLFQTQLINSILFEPPASRATLVPNIVRWIKGHLGRFDELSMTSPKDTEATKDAARVGWLEGVRLGVATIAAMLDRLHEALIDPVIRNNRSLLGQEQDNVEYVLGLLPRLLDSYSELQNTLNLQSIERHRSTTSVVSNLPVTFPSSYPFPILSYPPESIKGSSRTSKSVGRPDLQNAVGEIAVVLLVMILLSPIKILNNFFSGALEVEGKDNLARFLSSFFQVSTSILENEAFPSDWLNINVLAHRVVVKLVGPVADLLEKNFIPPTAQSYTFNTSLWRSFFEMVLKLLASPQLVIEEFSPQKRRAVWRLAGDIRGEGAAVLLRLWDAIGWPEERSNGSAPVTRFGGYQVQFIPALVEGVLELCLSHHDELRNNAVHVLYSMIVSEWHLNDDFAVIEAEVIDRLDKLFMSQTKGDEISRAFFISQLRALFDSASIDDRLREQVSAFLESVNQFLDLLLAIRNLPEGEEWLDDRIIGTLKLMSFIRGIGRSEIFVRYVNRLVGYHVASGNETEAGLTLKLHADLHSWDFNTFCDPIPDLRLPRQSDFARKETLYMRILEHLAKGKAWECAIEICKELQFQYEHRSFNYERLAELLVHEAELYASIVKSDRYFSEYFRVAFYGNRFPASVQNKQFIYRGLEWEKFSAFCERLQNKHPNAQLLKTNTLPPEEVQYADGQFLQITSVNPEPDYTSPIFQSAEVPQAIKTYYEHNATNTFSFTRPVKKENRGLQRVTNDFVNLWTEKTVLICEDAFPTVLRRSEVVEVRIVELSPIENALSSVEKKTAELESLEKRYLSLSKTSEGKINTNVLSMALNGAVDAPVNGGIPMYRKAFFGSDFILANPDKAYLVKRLQEAIEAQVKTLDRCMRLHEMLAPPEMKPFHLTLKQFFERNFAEEIARLPPEPYSPPNPPISNGIAITTNPSEPPSARASLSRNRSNSATTYQSTQSAAVTGGGKKAERSFTLPPVVTGNQSQGVGKVPAFYEKWNSGGSMDGHSGVGREGTIRSVTSQGSTGGSALSRIGGSLRWKRG
ncbi:hypothetical protein BT69DRAFT_1354118 [Atractiella rhizophila]|nr:hypothetical protein BT69DRAFT_1354118 [Atractiella rhizophila]